MYLFIPKEKLELLKTSLESYKQEYQIEDKDIPLTPVLKTQKSGLKMQTGTDIPLQIDTIGFTLEVENLPSKYLELIDKENISHFENSTDYLQFIETLIA